MLILVIYLIGCITVLFFGKDIMILSFLTMREPFFDDGLKIWEFDDPNDFPPWVYMLMMVGLSWLFVIFIYIVTIIQIIYKRKFKSND